MAKFRLPRKLMGVGVFLLAVCLGIGAGAGTRAFSQGVDQPILGVETYSEIFEIKSRTWLLNKQGTVIENSRSTHHPLPSQGLPSDLYLNIALIFGDEREQGFLREWYPESALETTRTGPYGTPPFAHYPCRIDADLRPESLYSPQVPVLYQSEGPWAEEEMRPGGPKASMTGCALTALCMAAGYSARTIPDLTEIKTLGLIPQDGQNKGNVLWAPLFDWLLAHGANDGRFLIDARQLMAPLFAATESTAKIVGVHGDDLRKLDLLEKILRERRAMAIIRVPSLGSPNPRPDGKTFDHFVLCTGIETDTVDGTPLKRFRIHDPGRANFSRPIPGVTPVRYLDQHKDSHLRSTDFTSGSGMWEVRYFIIPAPAAPMEQESQALAVTQTTSQNVSGDFLSWSAPDDISVIPMHNGTMLDFVGLTLAGKMDSSTDNPENLSDANAPMGTAATVSLIGCAPGSYNFLAFDTTGSGMTRKFVVRVGRMGQASAPATYVGEVSGATGMGTLTLSVAAPTESGFQAWLTANTLTGALETDDPDKDKVPLLLEYALGLLPAVGDNRPGNWNGSVWTKGLPRGELETAGGTRLVIGFARRTDDTALTYAPEFSTSLAAGSWVPGEQVSVQTIDTNWEYVKFRCPASPASARWYARIRVGY